MENTLIFLFTENTLQVNVFKILQWPVLLDKYDEQSSMIPLYYFLFCDKKHLEILKVSFQLTSWNCDLQKPMTKETLEIRNFFKRYLYLQI